MDSKAERTTCASPILADSREEKDIKEGHPLWVLSHSPYPLSCSTPKEKTNSSLDVQKKVSKKLCF